MPPAPLPPSSLASTTTRFPLALRLLVPWAVLVGAGSGGDGAAPSAVHAVPPGGRLAHFPAELAPGRGGGRAAPLLPALHAAGRAGGPRLPPAPASSWRVSAPPARGLRLRGGGKSKSARARSWKEQSKHHAELRKKSIRKNRNKNPQEATYTKEARENIRKVADARRLRELEENQEHKRRMAEERATDFNHLLRLDYMRANEEADRRRAEKYQTLDDYSDSIERELEELRQKRGESRCLTVPDWREGHPGYWKTVEKEAQNADIDDPEKVWKAAVEDGDVWRIAAYNRRHAGEQTDTSERKLALTTSTLAAVSYQEGGGGGGGMQLAQRQAAALDPGPLQFEEASSGLEQEEEEKDRLQAEREKASERKRKEAKATKKRLRRAREEEVQGMQTETEMA